MAKILVATHNPAKINSYRNMLSEENIEFVCLSDLGITQSAPEDLSTFKDNAIAKAKFYQALSNLPTLSEDSGIEIDALNGWPGIFSRRIWGKESREATDEEIIGDTIKKMENVPFDKRACHMKVVMALAIDQDNITTAEAQTDCYIALQPSQHLIKGFPYRSMFYLPEYKAIESDLEYDNPGKDFMTHRKNAIIKLTPLIKQLC